MRGFFIALLILSTTLLFASEGSLGIKADQVGYLPQSEKRAVVTSHPMSGTFRVLDVKDGKEAYHGKLSSRKKDADSGDEVQIADFSPLTVTGTYVIETGNDEKSFPFTIALDVFGDAFYLSMRSFYGQRCGCAVDLGPRFPGYKHEACHGKDAEFHKSSGRTGIRPATRGWHDAGDYGKYIVNSGLSTGTLLWAWEWYGDRLKGIVLDIPESGNKVPDFLDEVKWNLDWMLSMQEEDGGVYHKLTSERFGGFTMPEKDDAGPRFIIGTGREPYQSTGATADFAAVMALASRIYKPYSVRDSEIYLNAAKSAFAWATEHPEVTFGNPSGVRTGGYGDGNLSDEILWAAAELFRTTGESAYNRYFLEHLPKKGSWVNGKDPQAWPLVQNMALWSYALCDMKGTDPGTRKKVKEDTLRAAQCIVDRHGKNGYLNSLTSSNYIWGSNSVAMNYSILLLVADRFKKNQAFQNAAWDNLHYVLGRNTFNVSWVSQVGGNPYRHPHHRPSGADKIEAPWPGLLAGGPNAGRQDGVLAATRGQPPARAWVDDQGSYAGNEVAINWNAPLVFVLAASVPIP